jgi:hypothetical protein
MLFVWRNFWLKTLSTISVISSVDHVVSAFGLIMVEELGDRGETHPQREGLAACGEKGDIGIRIGW